ncbi:hypothetical protein CYMTET_9720 [Cymbomonas tetramitiformis]|uniref:cGMP-dependent protein kinase n=1 Tax=Cymbomonas tetramitiformis TaxID=36881 RepID=A0AAE0GS59_9CHLO|nr:hypothetical protein CYMTET_9720 [Cymbomonas tetramitiformis]
MGQLSPLKLEGRPRFASDFGFQPEPQAPSGGKRVMTRQVALPSSPVATTAKVYAESFDSKERRLPDDNGPPAKHAGRTFAGVLAACEGIAIFQGLKIKDRSALFANMYELTYKQGEEIVEQGTSGRNMYVVVDGNPIVIEKEPTTDTIVQERILYPGDTFGEVSLVCECPHSATVMVPDKQGSKVTLWALNRKTFQNLLSCAALERRKVLTDVLRQIPLFKQLCEYTIIQLEKAFVTKQFQKGDVVLDEESKPRFHVVVKGEAVKLGLDFPLADGMYFGEELLTENTHIQVIAQSPLETWSLDRRSFKRIIDSIPLKEICPGQMAAHFDLVQTPPPLITRRSPDDGDDTPQKEKQRHLTVSVFSPQSPLSRPNSPLRAGSPLNPARGTIAGISTTLPALFPYGGGSPPSSSSPLSSPLSSQSPPSSPSRPRSPATRLKPLSNMTRTNSAPMGMAAIASACSSSLENPGGVRLPAPVPIPSQGGLTPPCSLARSETFECTERFRNLKFGSVGNLREMVHIRPARMENMCAEEMVFLTELGFGLTGQVFLCEMPERDVPYVVVKKMLKSQLLKVKQVENAIRERDILDIFNSPFIVASYGSFSDETHLYTILEWCNGGDLFQHLCNFEKFNAARARFYAAEVLIALEYIHKCGHVYRDLKPENILLTEIGHVKLVDMGFCKEVKDGDRKYTTCGTLDYMAPEVTLCQGHDKSADFWSFGVLVFEMLAGYAPFDGRSNSERLEKRLAGKIGFPEDFNLQAKDLVVRLCRVDVSQRLGMGPGGFEDIKAHPFFGNLDWEDMENQLVKPPSITKGVDPSTLKQKAHPISSRWPTRVLTPEEQAQFITF